MNILKRTIISTFGKTQFWIRRKDYWWSYDLKIWVKNPWEEGSAYSKGDWSNGRFTRSRKEAFDDFEECIDKGIPCSMEEDVLFLRKRYCLWDYKSEDQIGFGDNKETYG